MTARKRKKPAPPANPAIVVGQEYEVWITEKALIYGIRHGRAHFNFVPPNGAKPYSALVSYGSGWTRYGDRTVCGSDYHFTLAAAKARLVALVKIRRASIKVALGKLDAISRACSAAGKLPVTEYGADKAAT